jgi:hypothetical protein
MTKPLPPQPEGRRKPKGPQKRIPETLTPTPANDAGEFVFGGAYRPAELERWATFPRWEAMEAACVTCGFEPQPIQNAATEALETQPEALAEIGYRTSLFQRSIKAGMIEDHFAPMDALQILEDRNCWYPTKLKEVASEIPAFNHTTSPPAATQPANSGANDNQAIPPDSDCRFTSESGRTKVIKLYQQMLLALSLEYLDLIPERPQNPTAKLILKAMDKHFEKLPHEDTVRDHIGHWINDAME